MLLLRLTASRCLRQEWLKLGGVTSAPRTLVLITKLRRRTYAGGACAFSSTLCGNRRVFSQLAGNHSQFDVRGQIDSEFDSPSCNFVAENFLSSEKDDPSMAEQPFLEAGGGISDNQSDQLDPENDATHLHWDSAGHDLEAEAPEVDNEKLQKVLSLLQSSVDGSLESTLDALDLDVHEEFMVQLLETPFVMGENFIRFFKWAAARKKPGVGVTTREIGALVRTISVDLRIRDAYSLWGLIKEMGENDNSPLNVEILNQLISIFAKVCRGKAAMEVFNKFGDFGFVPDSNTFYYTIEALCKRSIFDLACLVSEKMLISGALPGDLETGNIITWLCKGKKAKEAHDVFALAKEKNKSPPRHAIDTMIHSLSEDDRTVKLAQEMLQELSGAAQKYAIKPFMSVVRGLCRIKDVDEAKRLVQRMIAEGPPPGNAVFNLIITAYSKKEDMEGAMEMLELMKQRGLRPDLYTYTLIMSGYAACGQMEKALSMVAEAKKNHSRLNRITYHVLIRGYCKLQQFDKALELLSEMGDFGVQANTDEYKKLIHSLCFKALNWEAAEKLLGEMKQKGMYVNAHSRALVQSIKELEEEEALQS